MTSEAPSALTAEAVLWHRWCAHSLAIPSMVGMLLTSGYLLIPLEPLPTPQPLTCCEAYWKLYVVIEMHFKKVRGRGMICM